MLVVQVVRVAEVLLAPLRQQPIVLLEDVGLAGERGSLRLCERDRDLTAVQNLQRLGPDTVPVVVPRVRRGPRRRAARLAAVQGVQHLAVQGAIGLIHQVAHAWRSATVTIRGRCAGRVPRNVACGGGGGGGMPLGATVGHEF
eukprot:SAG22_NODE_283_length_13027_cov_25.568535_11_plen_143_part_00